MYKLTLVFAIFLIAVAPKVSAELDDEYFREICAAHRRDQPVSENIRHHYFRLGDGLNGVEADHFFLVITSTNLVDTEKRQQVEELLRQHGTKITLIIDVERDGQFVTQNGHCELKKNKFPGNMTYVYISDVHHNVTSIDCSDQDLGDGTFTLSLTPSFWRLTSDTAAECSLKHTTTQPPRGETKPLKKSLNEAAELHI